MVVAVISEHLVGTRYYLFFPPPYTFSPFLTVTLQKRPSAEGNTEAEATQVTGLETTPKSLTKVRDVSHRCHAAGVGRRAISKETQAPQ